jgi:nucleoside phosphorylase
VFDNIFLDFLNRDSRQIFGTYANFQTQQHITALTEAINVAAFLCGSFCAVPPGFLVEDELAAEALLGRRSGFLQERLVRMPLREAELDALWQKKEREYAGVRNSYPGLFDPQRRKLLNTFASALLSRRRKAGEEIVKAWTAGPDVDGRWRVLAGHRPHDEIEIVRSVPEQIAEEGAAVTWPAIQRRLGTLGDEMAELYRPLLQHYYFTVYLDEYRLAVIKELPFARVQFVGEQELYNNYESLRRALRPLGLFELVVGLSADSLVELRERRGYYAFCELYGTVVKSSKSTRDVGAAFADVASRMPSSTKSDPLASARRIAGVWAKGVELAPRELDAIDEQLQMAAEERDHAVEVVVDPARPRSFGPTAQTLRVGVFVALAEEAAIIKQLWNLKDDYPNLIARGQVGPTAVDLITARQAGRVPAAVKIMEYLARPDAKPHLLIVAGIAGGFQEEHVELGDVIIADRVIDLAHRKVRVSEERLAQEFRPQEFGLDERLSEFVESDAFDTRNWTAHVIERLEWPEGRRPTVRFGAIASVDEVVASDGWREQMLRAAPKLKGVEMEAGGVCAAAKKRDVPVAVVRGVSDLADPMKSDSQWRGLAMKAVVMLLEEALSSPQFTAHLRTT